MVLSSSSTEDVPPWQSAMCWAFSAYCPTPTLFDYPFGFVYFWMLAFANIFVLTLMLSVVGGLLMRLRSPAWWLSRMWADPESTVTPFADLQKETLGKTPLTVLLPCYLPNEQCILDQTIRHIVEDLEYGFPFKLIVCYNTPEPVSAYEKELLARDGHVYPSGRSLQVLRVPGSVSKAQNLNEALSLVDTERVVIYDADHHPDPHSLLIASAHMAAKGCTCVQGSTYLRERPTVLASYINAEFFVTHFVFFPAMEFVARMGVFGGSNALWMTDALRAYEFRHDVQTEDIDLSARALLGGEVRISFCPECRSGELPPATFRALYRQRLRWALGWDEATLQYMHRIGSSDASCMHKFGMYYILPLRWALLFSATLNALITPLVAQVFSWYSPEAELGLPITSAIAISYTGFLVLCCVVFVNTVIHERWQGWLAVGAFQVTGMLYIGWQLLLVVVSLSKVLTGSETRWEVTQRAQASGGASSAERGTARAAEEGGLSTAIAYLNGGTAPPAAAAAAPAPAAAGILQEPTPHGAATTADIADTADTATTAIAPPPAADVAAADAAPATTSREQAAATKQQLELL